MPVTTRVRSTRRRSPSRYGSVAGSASTTAYLMVMAVPSFISRATSSKKRLLVWVIQAGIAVAAERIVGFQIEDQRHPGGRGDLAIARFQAARVPRIAARQHHDRRKTMTLEHARLFERVAEGRSDAGNRYTGGRHAGEPGRQLLELTERGVIEKGVAAVEEVRDAAGLDVAGDCFGGVEIDRAIRRRAAGERRNREEICRLERRGI